MRRDVQKLRAALVSLVFSFRANNGGFHKKAISDYGGEFWEMSLKWSQAVGVIWLLESFDFVLFPQLLRIAPQMVALPGQDEAFYPSCITIFLSIAWWIEQTEQPSSKISQKEADSVRGRLNQPRPQGQLGLNEIATVVAGCPRVHDSGFSLQ